jgi:hypothetical protein
LKEENAGVRSWNAGGVGTEYAGDTWRATFYRAKGGLAILFR